MSTSLDFQVYLEKTRQLARTIVIKSEITAAMMNKRVIERYGVPAVNMEDPSSWRYYKHLCGEYHGTDEIMTIKSWDNTEEIIFSKENLAIHRATARAYGFGTKQFEELVSRYPEQDLLILGILYPAEINKAISAEDGSVLAYPPDLIEGNEYSLVYKIENFCKGYLGRWYNSQYTLSDELYAAGMLAVLYQQLYLGILNFRLEACKTTEAHSFHINSYLISHGIPEKVLPHLTKKQSLFLYRNIKYIRVHAGKDDVFRWLIENLFTQRYLPISEYTMRHYDDALLDTLYPTVQFKHKPLNPILGSLKNSLADLDDVLSKEQDLVAGNYEFIQDNRETIARQFETAPSNVIQTKMLESAVVDYSSAVYADLDKIYLNYWPYLAKAGIYSAFIGFTNARTGEQMMLSAGDAYLLMLYAGVRVLGHELIEVPPVFCERVFRYPIPPAEDFLSIASSITEAEVEAIRSQIPDMSEMVSIDAFNEFCSKVQAAEFVLKRIYTDQHSHFRRAEMKAVVYRSFTDSWVDLAPANKAYATWLNERNLNLADYTQTDFAMLYSEIYRAGTGLELDVTPTIVDVQKAMGSLLLNLSSYSIQLVNQISVSDLIDLQKPAIRVNNDGVEQEFLVDIPLEMVRCQEVKYDQDLTVSTVSAKPVLETNLLTEFSFDAYSEVRLDVQLDYEMGVVYEMDLSRLTPRILAFEIE